ncbi:hypothetical protein IGI04_017537, partial [Brassica rapa subsp. trilocularis]
MSHDLDQQSQRRIKCKRGLKYTYWRSRSQKVFLALPCLEELVLDVGKNVKQSGVALEALNSKEVFCCCSFFLPPQDRDVNQRSLSLPGE